VIGNSAGQQIIDDRHSRYGVPFLASYRALAACTRELARLGDEVLRGVAALPVAATEERATIRRSPDRCIVQLGPVALTIGWLRASNEAVASGELLVIVWRGTVAPRTERQPERPPKGPARLGATPLWEHVLTAVGDSEEAWGWQWQDDGVAQCSSAELAACCVNRLRAAYHEREVPDPRHRDAVDIT
jgi:hypothetical protein